MFASACLLPLEIGDSNPDRYIGHADQANAAIVARNIARGNGATTNNYWLLFELESSNDASLPRLEQYWSFYHSYIIAGCFSLFGDCRQSVLLAACLAKLVTSLGVGFFCLRLTKQQLIGFAAGLLVLIHQCMLNQINGLSDIYLTMATVLFLNFYCHALVTNKSFSFACCGIALGLAIGFKPSGLLLAGLFPSAVFFVEDRFRLFKGCFIALAVCLGVLVPNLLHNINAGGGLFPPHRERIERVQQTAISGLSYDEVTYDPGVRNIEVTGSLQLREFLKRVKQIGTMCGDSRAVIVCLLPLTLLAVFQSFVRYCKGRFRYRSEEDLLSACWFSLSIGILIMIWSQHVEYRYFNFMVPPSVILAIAFSARIGVNSIAAFALAIAIPTSFTILRNQQNPEWQPRADYVASCNEIKAILPKDSVVLTSNPWEFSFHTDLKSVAIPLTTEIEKFHMVSERFDVTHLAVINNDARHPAFWDFIKTKLSHEIETVLANDKVYLVKFK